MGIVLYRQTQGGLCIPHRTFLFFIAILATAGWLTTAVAWGHRWGPGDPCRRELGASLLHLTLYQPQFDPDGEYCEEVPREGKTVMIVDVSAGELRQIPISLEVVATAATGHSHTILSLPAKVYRLGIADTEVMLAAGSNYVAHVSLQQDAMAEPQLLSFPIQVAAWYQVLILPGLIVIGLLAITIISAIRYQVTARQNDPVSM
jgi:hypothetical protein